MIKNLKTYDILTIDNNGLPPEKEFIVRHEGYTQWSINCVSVDGYPDWELYREDGPSLVWDNGSEEWWVNGEVATSWGEYQQLSGCSDMDLDFLKLKYKEPS